MCEILYYNLILKFEHILKEFKVLGISEIAESNNFDCRKY
jgi:hypothetical protein